MKGSGIPSDSQPTQVQPEMRHQQSQCIESLRYGVHSRPGVGVQHPPQTDTSRRFVIESCVGQGGFGEVYRATMTSLGGLDAEVALKVLRADLDPGAQAVERLRDEARMLAQLNHPAILSVHDLVVLEGRVGLVMEYIEGADLAECLTTAQPIPPRALLESLGAVADALESAWSTPRPDGSGPMQIIHRDIKPSNIRLSRHGQVKLLDFGIARTDGMARAVKTSSGVIIGSPGYMAPERFLAEAPDPSSDVYALGVILFEGLAGIPFFEGLDLVQMSVMAVATERYASYLEERLGQLGTHRAATLARSLLSESLAGPPEERPTAAAFADRCHELARRLTGPDLRTWARGFTWSDIQRQPQSGPLAGRTLHDSLAFPAPTSPRTVPVAQPPAPVAQPSGRRRAVLLGALLASTGASIAVLTALLAGFALLTPLWSPQPDTASDALATEPHPAIPDPTEIQPAPSAPPDRPPAEPDAPRQESTPPASTAPSPRAPVPVPSESAGGEQSTPASRPRESQPPAPEAPEPEPEAPEPEAPEPETGRVTTRGKTPVRLRGPAGPAELGLVAPGRYTIEANFSGQWISEVGVVDIRPGDRYRIECKPVYETCSARVD